MEGMKLRKELVSKPLSYLRCSLVCTWKHDDLFKKWKFISSSRQKQILSALSQPIANIFTSLLCMKCAGWFFIYGPSDFQYQNEKWITANPSFFFKKKNNVKQFLVGWASFYILVLKMGRRSSKKLPVQCRTFCLALIHDFAKQFYYKLMTWQCSNIFTILPSLQ